MNPTRARTMHSVSDTCRRIEVMLTILIASQAAQVLVEISTRCCTSTLRQDTSQIAALLCQVELPIELQALAYAMIEALYAKGSILDCEPALLLTAALALADIHINDRPYHLLTWARLLTNPTTGIRQLDRTMLAILRSLDWTLHRFCDPTVVTQHITTLIGTVQHLPSLHTQHSSTATWVLGQLTPVGGHSPCPQAQSKQTYFLPLL